MSSSTKVNVTRDGRFFDMMWVTKKPHARGLLGKKVAPTLCHMSKQKHTNAPKEPVEREYITIKDASRLIVLKPWTLYGYLSRGRLSRYKAGRRTLLDKREVLGLVRKAEK